jgi:hypothetical protein
VTRPFLHLKVLPLPIIETVGSLDGVSVIVDVYRKTKIKSVDRLCCSSRKEKVFRAGQDETGVRYMSCCQKNFLCFLHAITNYVEFEESERTK